MNASRTVGVAVVIPLILVACSLRAPTGVELPHVAREIAARASAAQPEQVISLQDVASEVAWTAMVIVGPYPENDDFEKVAGFYWNVEAAGSSVTEGNTIAFVAGDQVVAWTVLTGNAYFLPEEDTALMVQRPTATFRVSIDEDGRSRWLVHTPVGG